MRKLPFYFLILIMIIGCSGSKIKPDKRLMMIEQVIDKEYHERKDFFKKEFVNHFPEKLHSNYITFTDCESPEGGPLTLRLINKINEEQSITKLIEKAMVHYAADDSCLLIVNRFATKDRFYKIVLSAKEKDIVNKNCYNDKVPIPNFWDSKIFSNTTDTRLPADFIIYVLDYKAGKFASNNLLTDGGFMPKKWKNGYSKGLAVSEKQKIIIYWIEIW